MDQWILGKLQTEPRAIVQWRNDFQTNVRSG